jgi:hypothetical protein
MLPLVPPEVVFFAAHEESKLLVQAPPKGGATLAVQLVLRAAGLESTAAAYARRNGSTLSALGELVHTYHSKVMMRQRHVNNCTHCSTNEDWGCIKLVRSPFDRVVSSYLRTAENPARRSNLPEMRDNGSFSDFVHALEARANRSSHEQQRLANMHKADHYLPQLRPACDLLRKHARAPGGFGTEDAALPLVPIECVESALTHLQSRLGPASAAYLRLDPRNLSAPSHYRDKSSNAPIGAADPVWMWDYATHFSAHRAVPPYSAFLGEPRLREAVNRLFADDVELYEAACRQQWLRGSNECMAMCAAWRACRAL